MIDFDMDAQREMTVTHYLIFLISYYFVIYCNRDLHKYHYSLEDRDDIKRRFVLVLGLCILTIAAITRGDFYHYMEVVQHYTIMTYSPMEDVYLWLAIAVKNNYLLWRICVWGTALMCYYLTIKRLKINASYALFALFVCYLPLYNYARASLAFSVYFLGLSFLIKPLEKSKIISFIIGAILIYTCRYFHTSAYILIASTLVIIIPYNKWTISAMLVVCPIFIKYLGFLMFDNNYLAIQLDDELVEAKLNSYNSMEIMFAGGLSGFLQNLLQYGSFYVPAFIICKKLYLENEKRQFPKEIKLLFKVAFFLMLVATLFAFVSETQKVYFYRILFMSMIPLSLIISYLFTTKNMSLKLYKFVINWCILSITYECVYNVYLRLL